MSNAAAPVAASVSRAVTPARRLNGSEKLFVACIVVPALIHFSVFTLFPVIASFFLSFTDWKVLGTPNLVGLENYIELWHSQKFHEALKRTFLFALFYVPPMMALPLLMALLVNRSTRAAGFFKTAYFLPVVTSFVVFALIFKWTFQADPSSMANVAMRGVGLPPRRWLQDAQLALPLLALLGLLKGAAWNMVYFIAGLQSIPEPLYEAARVDGAGPWRIFRQITLPLLRPTIYFVAVLTTIGAFQVFDSAYLLTQGGPGYATTTIVYFIYQAGFENFRMGYASASAYVLLAMVLLVTWVQKRWLGKTADWY
ncbi:MAG: carbohydrate ABC transporter permease [Candidatus Sumerlaeaceae bacterium]